MEVDSRPNRIDVNDTQRFPKDFPKHKQDPSGLKFISCLMNDEMGELIEVSYRKLKQQSNGSLQWQRWLLDKEIYAYSCLFEALKLQLWKDSRDRTLTTRPWDSGAVVGSLFGKLIVWTRALIKLLECRHFWNSLGSPELFLLGSCNAMDSMDDIEFDANNNEAFITCFISSRLSTMILSYCNEFGHEIWGSFEAAQRMRSFLSVQKLLLWSLDYY